MTSKPVLFIQGASGNVGSATVKALATKYKDRAIIKAAVPDTSAQKAQELKELGIEIVEFSTDKPDTFASIRGATKVLIIPPNARNRQQIAARVADLAVEYGAQHLVLLSALGAKKENTSIAKEFRSIERHILTFSVKYTFVRAAMFMENFILMKDSIKKGILPLPIKNGKYAPVSVADVGEAIAAVLIESGHENKEYELTGPETLSGNDIAKIFSEFLGKPVKYVDADPQDVKKELMKLGTQEWQANAILELYQLVAEGKLNQVTTDLRQLIKRDPTTFKQFVKQNLQLFAA